MDYSYSEEYLGNADDEIIHCYCEDHCPFGDERGICSIKPGGMCFTSVEAATDESGYEYPLMSYGCFPANEMALMQCKGSLVPHADSKSIQCCNEGDFCNRNLFPMYRPKENASNPDKLPLFILVSSLSCCLVVLFLVMTVAYLKYRKRLKKQKNFDTDEEGYGVNNNEENDKKEHEAVEKLTQLMEQSQSGQRTIAKEIEMERSAGKGRYGEVWLARWREERVAVKIYFSTEVQSWFRETEIYQTVLMRHDNILGFIAADVKAPGMMLVTDYHEHGSLFDFLQGHTLNPSSLLIMCRSVARGLAYLHTEIFGIHGKPSIAHRDLKSRNILVKNNGECCIADFGLAVKFHSNVNQIDLPKTDRQGTKRYMAPEILDGSLDIRNFDTHKMADMYSFGLVLWEMTRRCVIDGQPALDYAMPYQELIPDEPTFEDMRKVVCFQKIRPEICDSWNSIDVLKLIAKVMQELWHSNPAVRLTALRVKKTLIEFRETNSMDMN